MSNTVIPIADTFHYYHKGSDSRPAWAYNNARQQIAGKWAGFMKAMPDTANVKIQDVVFENLGGSISRLGVFPKNVKVSGAGSKTKKSWDGKRTWETWFDVEYELQLIFVSSADAGKVGSGLSIDEINKGISAAGVT